LRLKKLSPRVLLLLAVVLVLVVLEEVVLVVVVVGDGGGGGVTEPRDAMDRLEWIRGRDEDPREGKKKDGGEGLGSVAWA
jgi:hypothetical protein